MAQQEPSSRFSHKLSQLQQARFQDEITGDEYKNQLTAVIEEETRSHEEVNQGERRAYLWRQAEASWERFEKAQQERVKQATMQAQQDENEKLQPFIQYVQKTMDDDLPEMRSDSRRYRNLYNRWQAVVIVGSAIATAIVNINDVPRWYTSIVTVIVAAASGFLVAYKFKERSTTLQQTGDLIDAEYEAFHLQLDEYDTPNVEARYKSLTRRLKRLKEEQRNRELLLEQSPEAPKQASPAIQS